MPIELEKYISLVKSFLENRVNADEYVSKYFDMFLNEREKKSDQEYEILNNLFLDTEEFTNSPTFLPDMSIDEQELRRRAKIALKNLNEMAEDEKKYKEKVARQKKELIDIIIKWNLLNSVPDNEREEEYNEFVKLVLMLFYDNDNKQKMIKCIRERLQKYLPNKSVPSDIDKFVDELLIWKEKSEDQTSKQ